MRSQYGITYIITYMYANAARINERLFLKHLSTTLVSINGLFIFEKKRKFNPIMGKKTTQTAHLGIFAGFKKVRARLP
jgi:hypothetical protein